MLFQRAVKPIAIVLTTGVAALSVLAQTRQGEQAPATAFFATLASQCGARYEGATAFPADPAHDFAGKVLVAELVSCNDSEIRIPFTVGSDRSRTWIIRHNGATLSLQHDHRHPDGNPDPVTLYGGQAAAGGSALSQSFPADAYTAQLIPAAATNVWTLQLSADGTTLHYRLERHGQLRYEAVLKRVPPTP